ncbi:MAG: flavodoxin family protein [Clostridiaceae bacterium]|nr:flavodoxin family protein [Clostridiaceae bacterium]
MSRILILNAIPDDTRPELETQLDKLTSDPKQHFECKVIRLRDLDIRYCTGCWDCWVKTPGLCAHKDAMTEIYPEVIAADSVVFLSPISMGFVTALCKKVCDRLIPLVHPYFEIYKGEMHHKSRYEKRPALAVWLTDESPESVDLDNIHRLFERLSVNMKTDFSGVIYAKTTMEDIANALSAL